MEEGLVAFKGCRTPCPRCGEYAELLTATYEIEGGVAKPVSGNPSVFALSDRLAAIAKAAREKSQTATEILQEVAEVSPELAEKLKTYFPLPAFVLILVLIWLVKSVSLDISVDLNALIDQAYHLSQGEDPERHLDSDPPASPVPPHRVLTPAQPRTSPQKLPYHQELPPSEQIPATWADTRLPIQNRQTRLREKALAKKRLR